MESLTALTFNRPIFWPALINGITTAGLYGLIAVAMVLSYRISRTVAFVHGGIVLIGHAAVLVPVLAQPEHGQRAARGQRPVDQRT